MWSKTAFRRRLSRLLTNITRPTDWHAWLGKERGLYVVSDEPDPDNIAGFFVAMKWFSKKNPFKLFLKISAARSETVTLALALPYLVSFDLMIDCTGGLLRNITKILRGSSEQNYGVVADRCGLDWRWGCDLIKLDGKRGTWFWKSWQEIFNGKPIFTTFILDHREVVYIQPAYQVMDQPFLAPQEVRLILTSSYTTVDWKVFWKRPKSFGRVDGRIHSPPKISSKEVGCYSFSMHIDLPLTMTDANVEKRSDRIDQAIDFYRQKVSVQRFQKSGRSVVRLGLVDSMTITRGLSDYHY